MSEYLEGLIKRSNDAVAFTKNNSNRLLYKVVIPLSTAGEKTLNIQGNYIYGVEANNIDDTINIQFSRNDSLSDSFAIVKGFGHIHPFDKIYCSWSAQAGGSITLYVANLAPELMGVIDNRSEVIQASLLQDIVDNTLILNSIPSTATRVYLTGTLHASSSVDMYTVPAGKTLYINTSVLALAYAPGVAAGYVQLGTDDSQMFSRVACIGATDEDKATSCLLHMPSIPVVAGKKVQLTSFKYDDTAQNAEATAVITGWLI